MGVEIRTRRMIPRKHHRAGAAPALVASDFGARQAQRVAQVIRQLEGGVRVLHTLNLCMHTDTHTHTEREREKEREQDTQRHDP